MQDQQATAIGGVVNRLVGDRDIAEVQGVIDVASQELVVIAGDVVHRRPLFGLAQDFTDDIGVRLRPVPVLSQLPAVDDVADQIQENGRASCRESVCKYV